MKNIILRVMICLVCLLGLLISLHAQVGLTEVTNGAEIKDKRNTTLNTVIGSEGNSIYAVRFTNNNPSVIYLESYNENLLISNIEKIKLSAQGADLTYEDAFYLNREIHLFTSFYNKAKDANYLFHQTYNPKSLKTIDKLKVVMQLPTARNNNRGRFSIKMSRDSSKVLVVGELPYNRGEAEKFKLSVFDNNFVSLWEKETVLPYNDEKFKPTEFKVDAQGNAFILGQYFINGVRRGRSGSPNFDYRIISYTDSGNASQQFTARLERKFISSLAFEPKKNGELVCAGFYSHQDANSARGTYYLKVNFLTGEILQENHKDFDIELLTLGMSKRKMKRAIKAENNNDTDNLAELDRINMKEIVLRSDGGAVVIGEQVRITTNNRNSWNDPFMNPFSPWRNNNFMWRNNNMRDFNFSYGDIVVANINATGEIDWATRIPKEQATINDGGIYSSFFHFALRDKLYFIFNDNARNYDDSTDKLYAYNGNADVVSMAVLGSDGKLEMYPILDGRAMKMRIRPNVIQRISYDEIIMLLDGNRKYRFSKIKL